MRCSGTRFVCVRYGNVLASRGSVIPLFHEQIRNGGPVTITTPDMTRFLLTLDDAVDTVFAAISEARPGETYVPRAPAARIVDVAMALIGNRTIRQVVTGIRPGEKTHEIMVSDEEAHRTVERGGDRTGTGCLQREYSSNDTVLTLDETVTMLKARRLMVEDTLVEEGELLR